MAKSCRAKYMNLLTPVLKHVLISLIFASLLDFATEVSDQKMDYGLSE